MLTITITVNGVPITMVSAYRDMSVEFTGSGLDKRFVYRYSAANMPMDLANLAFTCTGSLRHTYSDKICKLASMILNDVFKQEQAAKSSGQ
jgi:hypothetical protein